MRNRAPARSRRQVAPGLIRSFWPSPFQSLCPSSSWAPVIDGMAEFSPFFFVTVDPGLKPRMIRLAGSPWKPTLLVADGEVELAQIAVPNWPAGAVPPLERPSWSQVTTARVASTASAKVAVAQFGRVKATTCRDGCGRKATCQPAPSPSFTFWQASMAVIDCWFWAALDNDQLLPRTPSPN